MRSFWYDANQDGAVKPPQNAYAIELRRELPSSHFFDQRSAPVHKSGLGRPPFLLPRRHHQGMDAVSIKIGGIEDHVHVFTGLKSRHRLDHFMRDLKGDSSFWIHKEVTKMFEWQKGYGAFSVSPSAVDSVKRYVENQRAHHQELDFKTEFIDLLVKAGIEFDERFLW